MPFHQAEANRLQDSIFDECPFTHPIPCVLVQTVIRLSRRHRLSGTFRSGSLKLFLVQ